MKLPSIVFLLLVVGFSSAFIPTVLRKNAGLAWSSLVHGVITEAGLLCSVIEFLQDNPECLRKGKDHELASVNIERLLEGRVSNKLYRLVRSSKFRDAVKEIEESNANVDKVEDKITAAHFDAEQFVASSKRLIQIKKRVIALINKPGDNEVDYIKARKEIGRLLHTLQDFYSHSNWIETGNNDPLSILGSELIAADTVAGPKVKTCDDCTPVSKRHVLGLGDDDCHDNLVNTGKLTSGYFGGQDVKKPVDVGKCSHGGVFDSTRNEISKGGINKDSNRQYLSPHHRLHEAAARVAIKATKLIFNCIRKEVGDEKFAKFLSLKAFRTISFAIDTTGSMRDEIAAVRQLTVQFIEAADDDDEEHEFRYVLVPFNDPGVGPVLTTSDPDVAKNTANALIADGGGDCPEMGMSGLYLALLNSLPNSDVFYFSDAAAKDANLVFTVISVALQKQCRIIPLISGQCSSRRKRRSTSERQVYEQLASATGGQYIPFSKSNIDEVIKLVRPANVSEGNSSFLDVSLFSLENNTSELVSHSYDVNIDSTIFSITAILSGGEDPRITVVSPEDANETVNIVSQTSTFFAVRITTPSAGLWKFNITSRGPFSFKISARSSLDFSTTLEKKENSEAFEEVFVPVEGNPIKGSTLYLTVRPTESILQANKNITGYLIDAAGNRLERFDLQQGEDFYNNTYYGSFVVKYNVFKIMYIGYSKNGEIVQRVQPRVIRAQEFEVQISVQNSSLTLTPNETSTITVVLRNYGSDNNFLIVVSDDRSFVTSYSPQNVFVKKNDSVEIKIYFFAPSNTNDSTTTSVSVSASIQTASAVDLANFVSFQVSVFSKEFEFVNETELTSNLNISSLLMLSTPSSNSQSTTTGSPTGGDDDDDDGLPIFGIVLIAVACGLVVVSLTAIIILVSTRK